MPHEMAAKCPEVIICAIFHDMLCQCECDFEMKMEVTKTITGTVK
jgi:hypothetical protein